METSNNGRLFFHLNGAEEANYCSDTTATEGVNHRRYVFDSNTHDRAVSALYGAFLAGKEVHVTYFSACIHDGYTQVGWMGVVP